MKSSKFFLFLFPGLLALLLVQACTKLEVKETDSIPVTNTIKIDTPAGNSIVIDEQSMSIKITDQNQNTLTMNQQGVELKSPKNITIQAGMVLTLSAGTTLSIGGANISMSASGPLSMEGATAKLSSPGITELSGSLVKINRPFTLKINNICHPLPV